MSAHTPGPWTENSCEIQAADGSPICEMLARPEDSDKWGHHHADANSRLICAAPELLAALEQTLSTLDAICDMEGFDKHVQHGSREARAAITKAKGGE